MYDITSRGVCVYKEKAIITLFLLYNSQNRVATILLVSTNTAHTHTVFFLQMMLTKSKN